MPDSAESSIQLKTYVEQNKVPLNREVVYHVELSWKGTLNQFEIEKINEPVVTNLKLVSSGSSNKFILDDAGIPNSLRRITFYFTPLEMGMAYIDGVIINYEDKLLAQKSSLLAQRLGVEITEPVKEDGEPFIGSSFLLWVLTLAFFALVGFFVYRYLQRRKQEMAGEEIKPKTLEEKYLNILHDTIHPTSGSPRDNLNGLVRLVNSYVSEKAGITGTPDVNAVRSILENTGFSEDVLARIDEFYKQGERTRFAGEPVTQSDMHLYYDTIELILGKLHEQELNKKASAQ
jgi:hypothetical protein